MFFLAIRHLLSRKRQSVLILLGITLGTMIYVLISGIQLGFRQFIIDKLVDTDGHIRIAAKEEVISAKEMTATFFPERDKAIKWIVPPSGRRDEPYILYPAGWFSRLEKSPEVMAYAPQFKTQAIYTRGGIQEAGQIIGLDVEKQLRVTNIEKDVIAGGFSDLGVSGSRLVIGSKLAENLGVRVDDTVMVSTGQGSPLPFKIAGIFRTGVEQIDNSIAYGSISGVQQLAGAPGRVTDIIVKLNDLDMAREVALRWSTFSREKIQSWDQANENFLQLFKVQDFTRNFITISILVIAAFGIYNVLSITISQKKREIAILRALGFPPKDIERLFLQQGFFLGLLGASSGLLLGFFLCRYFDSLKVEAFGPQGLVFSYAPSIYVFGFSMAVLAALGAGYFPAHAARKMTPVDIIRAEV